MLNRKFVRTDDAMKDSEETFIASSVRTNFLFTTAFNVSQTSHNSRNSLLIHELKSKRTWLEAI